MNGLELHYEIHGAGEPLVMLHGGVNPADMFGAPLVEMAKSARVDARLDGSGRVVHQLAIIPGTTHYDLLQSTAVTQYATQFLRR